MKYRISRWTMAVAALVALLALSSVRAAAQAPQAGAGKAASYPTGKQGLLGVKWNRSNTDPLPGYSVEGGRLEEESKIMGVTSTYASSVVDPPDGKIPYQPWARQYRDYRTQSSYHPKFSRDLDPNTKCYPSGEPHVMFRDGPLISEFPNYIVMEFEWGHQFRIIPTDNRPKLPSDLRLWFGDSRAHWDGDTLVIQTTNLNGYAWLSIVGDFLTENATLVEKLKRIDARTASYEVTITDPTLYTRPWTMVFHYVTGGRGDDAEAAARTPELWESACHEGNRNLVWRELSKQVGRTEAEPPKDAKGPIEQ